MVTQHTFEAMTRHLLTLVILAASSAFSAELDLFVTDYN